MAVGKQSTASQKSSLNDAKERAAGREEQNPQLNPVRDAQQDTPAKGQTGGAFGKDGHAHRNQATSGAGGGGGGGENSPAKNAAANIELEPHLKK